MILRLIRIVFLPCVTITIQHSCMAIRLHEVIYRLAGIAVMTLIMIMTHMNMLVWIIMAVHILVDEGHIQYAGNEAAEQK